MSEPVTEELSIKESAIEFDPELVRDELRRIFESRHFRTSKRCKQFLQYVVDQKLQGNSDSLKERLIGTEIFGRDSDYLTGEDPVVRVQAGEVRRRLCLYQAEDRYKGPLLVELPPGSYAPVFRLRSSLTEDGEAVDLRGKGSKSGPSQSQDQTASVPGVSNAPMQELPSAIPPSITISSEPINYPFPGQGSAATIRSSRKIKVTARLQGLAWGVAMTACLFAGVVYAFHFRADNANKSELQLRQFWSPAALSSRPILLWLSNPVFYRPSSALYQRYAKDHPGTFQSPLERYNSILPLNPEATLRWEDMIPMTSEGPAIGSVIAALNLARTFAKQGKPFEARFGNQASFAGLRDSPTVIIGAQNAQWTIQMNSGLPFAFEEANGQLLIRETSGHARTWKTEYGSKVQPVRDYGIVTREVASETGQFLVQVAGISDRGTEAASEVVSDPVELAAALAFAPKGWQHKNIEMVVSTDIRDGTSGPPHVVALRVW